jgi:cellulose synthase/poly-beta-1,6-N-acetylglucosamine synthase-like glycosyltransferase
MLGMILGILLVVVGSALFVPCAVLLLETVAALMPPRNSGDPTDRVAPPRTAILVPAHDESLHIGNTVRHLLQQPGPVDERAELIVIADNCTDDTAALARSAGATVIERTDSSRRGKGFAIAFGLRHLAEHTPPEIVVLVDADCRVSGSLSTLTRLAQRAQRPVQAEYLLGAPARATPMTAVSSLAILVRNRVRPRGLHRLGLPCQLTGSGMAFPWQVLRSAPETGANLVEDLVMGLEMALAGHPALFCPAVQITSDLPTDRKAAMSQRKRWEHGQLHTLLTYAPRLVVAGFRQRRLSLLALGLDLAVPPLALLTLAGGGVFAVAAVAYTAGWISWFPLFCASASMATLALAIVLAWFKFGRETISWHHAVLVPVYVLRKLPLYASLVFRGKQKTWERTARTDPDSKRPSQR